MNTKRQAVFLDRDGVINYMVERGENFFVRGKKVQRTAPFNYQEFQMKDGIRETLLQIRSLGFLCILATNQPDVTYGTLSAQEHKRIMSDVGKLPFDDIFVCPHGRDDGCSCKKPKPGMLLEAAEKWNIDLPMSFIVGDTSSDIGAGEAVHCKTILIDYDYNKDLEPDIRVKNLKEAIEFLAKR